VFIDLIEPEQLDGVTDLVLSRQRHDLSQIGVVTPVGAVKCLLARYPRKQRDVHPITHQSHIDIVPADREETECQLHHFRRAGAVDDGIEVTLAGGLAQLLADIARGFALDVDDVIDAILEVRPTTEC